MDLHLPARQAWRYLEQILVLSASHLGLQVNLPPAQLQIEDLDGYWHGLLPVGSFDYLHLSKYPALFQGYLVALHHPRPRCYSSGFVFWFLPSSRPLQDASTRCSTPCGLWCGSDLGPSPAALGLAFALALAAALGLILTIGPPPAAAGLNSLFGAMVTSSSLQPSYASSRGRFEAPSLCPCTCRCAYPVQELVGASKLG